MHFFFILYKHNGSMLQARVRQADDAERERAEPLRSEENPKASFDIEDVRFLSKHVSGINP